MLRNTQKPQVLFEELKNGKMHQVEIKKQWIHKSKDEKQTYQVTTGKVGEALYFFVKIIDAKVNFFDFSDFFIPTDTYFKNNKPHFIFSSPLPEGSVLVLSNELNNFISEEASKCAFDEKSKTIIVNQFQIYASVHYAENDLNANTNDIVSEQSNSNAIITEDNQVNFSALTKLVTESNLYSLYEKIVNYSEQESIDSAFYKKINLLARADHFTNLETQLNSCRDPDKKECLIAFKDLFKRFSSLGTVNYTAQSLFHDNEKFLQVARWFFSAAFRDKEFFEFLVNYFTSIKFSFKSIFLVLVETSENNYRCLITLSGNEKCSEVVIGQLQSMMRRQMQRGFYLNNGEYKVEFEFRDTRENPFDYLLSLRKSCSPSLLNKLCSEKKMFINLIKTDYDKIIGGKNFILYPFHKSSPKHIADRYNCRMKIDDTFSICPQYSCKSCQKNKIPMLLALYVAQMMRDELKQKSKTTNNTVTVITQEKETTKTKRRFSDGNLSESEVVKKVKKSTITIEVSSANDVVYRNKQGFFPEMKKSKENVPQRGKSRLTDDSTFQRKR